MGCFVAPLLTKQPISDLLTDLAMEQSLLLLRARALSLPLLTRTRSSDDTTRNSKACVQTTREAREARDLKKPDPSGHSRQRVRNGRPGRLRRREEARHPFPLKAW